MLGNGEAVALLLLTLAQGFFLWMVVDCLRNEPEADRRNRWIALILILNAPGALVYFVTRRRRRRANSSATPRQS